VVSHIYGNMIHCSGLLKKIRCEQFWSKDTGIESKINICFSQMSLLIKHYMPVTMNTNFAMEAAIRQNTFARHIIVKKICVIDSYKTQPQIWNTITEKPFLHLFGNSFSVFINIIIYFILTPVQVNGFSVLFSTFQW